MAAAARMTHAAMNSQYRYFPDADGALHFGQQIGPSLVCAANDVLHILRAKAGDLVRGRVSDLGDHDLGVPGKVPQCVFVRAMCQALGHGHVDLRRHLVLATQRFDVPRGPTIEEAETGARVVQFVVDACMRAEQPQILIVQTQTARSGLVEHPFQGHQRHPLFRVAAADVRVNACEPHLVEARAFRGGVSRRLPLRARIVGGFVPQHRLERHAWLVDRKRLAGVVDAPTQVLGRELELIDERVDEIAESEGQPDRVDGVPYAHERDRYRMVDLVARAKRFDS